MATEKDKASESNNEVTPPSGNIELRGKGWRVYAPIALVATLLANSGSFAGCARQDEVLSKLEAIEKKVDRQNEKIGDINVRVARIEGARGAPSQ